MPSSKGKRRAASRRAQRGAPTRLSTAAEFGQVRRDSPGPELLRLRHALELCYQELDELRTVLQEESSRANEAEERYGDLYDLAPVSYLLLDGAGLIKEINLTGCDLLGVHRLRLVGRPLLSFVHPDDRRVFLEHVRRSRRQDCTIESDLRLRSRDGRDLAVRLVSRRCADPGRPLYRTILMDFTELRRVEEERHRVDRDRELLQAASDAKDRFLAMLSHELRTPLTPALLAASQLHDRGDLPEAIRRLASAIQRNLELEARLIDDLLDESRISRGLLPLRLEPLDAQALLRDAMDICRPLADERGITIACDSGATAAWVHGDPTRLRQVFWNVLSNAIKFSHPDDRVDVRTFNDEAGRLCVTVSDRGMGIPPDALDRLFEPLERSPDAAQRSPRAGLGLGLAISRSIVEAHGGQIRAASAGLGSGATFEVRLATVPQPEAPAAGDPADRAPHEGAPRLRILLVEDDVETAAMLTMLLEQEGHEVVQARTLGAALGRAHEPWQVVISDLGLPDGSGLEVARRLASGPPPRAKLIALSGYGAEADLGASRDAGFDEHLVKPVDLDVLLGTLASVSAAPHHAGP